jgi:hypothetical protein
MGENTNKMHNNFQSENLRGRDNLGNAGIECRITLKQILMR